MLNTTDPFRATEARVRFAMMDFEILTQGYYVPCAVTGRRIPLDELRYWSVERQEAYVDADAALARWRQLNPGKPAGARG
jgi:hypothetical protein